MKVKYGVKLAGLKIQMRFVLKEAEAVWKEYGQECVITSATEVIDSDLVNFTEDSSFIPSAGS